MTEMSSRRSRTTTDYVTRELRERIRSGKLEAGSRLRQLEIAKELEVSATPVREAFFVLLQEGLLKSVPHKGVVVFTPSIEDLVELYTMRIALEAAATRLAVPQLKKPDLLELRSLVRKIEEADGRGDMEASNEFNHAFHLTIYKKAGMPRMLGTIEDLRLQSAIYLRIYDAIVDDNEASHREHEAILAFCEDYDADRAAEAMAVHLEHTLIAVKQAFARPKRKN